MINNLFLEDADLLEQIELEQLIEEQAYAERVKTMKAIKDAITIFHQLTYKDEFKVLNKIRLNPTLNRDDYANFVTNRSRSLILGSYDIEDLRYYNDEDDKLHEIPNLLNDIVHEINSKIDKGFYLYIEDKGELLGDIIIYRKIK